MDYCQTKSAPVNIQELINSPSSTIVDVRTASEFSRGSAKNAINLPLHELEARWEELKDKQPLILCCASGCRSGQATDYLEAQGFEAYNGGGWSLVAAQQL
jgi:rhodanese-related sulfurtransferase